MNKDGNKIKFSTLNQKENAQQEDRDKDGNRLEKMSHGREERNRMKLSFGSKELDCWTNKSISVIGRGGP
jgi:hypothetical protein